MDRPDKRDPESEEPSKGFVVGCVVLSVVDGWFGCAGAEFVDVVLAVVPVVLDPLLPMLLVSLG